MQIIAIVQARSGSKRFPNKIMKKINGKSIIELLLNRISLSKKINKVILATTVLKEDDILSNYVESIGYHVFRGSEKNVLSRYHNAAEKYKADVILRITGDCPLVDPIIIDKAINIFLEKNVDYVSNVNPSTYPDGMDIEVFTFKTLQKIYKKSNDDRQKEHVTTYLREEKNNEFKKINFNNSTDLSNIRLTIDEPEDFEVIKKIYEYFEPKKNFNLEDIMQIYKKYPKIFENNKHINRDTGPKLTTAQKVWKRANRVIPGGNMLLSKNPNQFLPNNWPTYFSKAKGCKIWDLDGKEYVDMSVMGVGTNILGYCNDEVDKAVKDTINMGNMSSLNCSEEVYLAEKLVNMHPWSDMAKFARSGGEANSIAIRIARAITGKDKIAVCGYHGWHDWYLSANLTNNEKLSEHLLPGLNPKGVPKNLKETVFPFSYNNLEELKKIIDNHPDIGAVKMEVSRNEKPKEKYLEEIRNITKKNNIILIFDECTSGFRETFGGLHKKYNISPDMSIFGKALGNGYAITAVLGKKEIMEVARETFISSTFWTERIGYVAALKTLEIMEEIQSWNIITDKGKTIISKWQELANKHGLKISIKGIPSIASFSFDSINSEAYMTLITQEMQLKGFLASSIIYTCVDHSSEVIENYFDSLDKVFNLIKECEEGKDIKTLLKGPVRFSALKRLN